MNKDWTKSPLVKVADLCLGKMLDKAKNKGTPRAYLRNSNGRWDSFDLTDVKEMLFEDHETERYCVRQGDVVVCKGGEPGRCAVWTRTDPFSIQKALHRVRCDNGLVPTFLAYQLQLFAANGTLRGHFTGSTINHLPGAVFAKLPIRFPSPAEQHRIVAAIETQFTRLDDAVATLERVKAKLGQARASVLKAAVEGRLVPTEAALAQAEGRDYEPASVLLERILAERRARWERAELAKLIRAGRPPMGDTWKRRYKAGQPTSEAGNLPDGWVWTTLDQLAHYNVDYRGKTPPTSGSGVPIISAANVKGGKIVLGGKTRFVTQEVYDRWTVRGLPEPGDLIVTTEAPVGETALYPSTGTYLLTRRVIGFQTSEVAPSFLGYAFHGAAGKKHLKKHNRGTTVPRILKNSVPVIADCIYPVPFTIAKGNRNTSRKEDPLKKYFNYFKGEIHG